MRSAVARLPAQTLGLPEVPTASIGIAAHRPGERIEDTLARADQALYRAKHLGRNRVEPWSGGGDAREAALA
jgi:PleD family two-component response regulator